MTLEDQIQLLTEKVAFLSVQIDSLKQSINGTEKVPQIANKCVLNMEEACAAYHKSYKTMRMRLERGIYRGQKIGKEWEIESPEDRQKRINKYTN